MSDETRRALGARRWAGSLMDRANLLVAILSAVVGAIALSIVLASGELIGLGGLLGVVLLLNAVIRYQLARQR